MKGQELKCRWCDSAFIDNSGKRRYCCRKCYNDHYLVLNPTPPQPLVHKNCLCCGQNFSVVKRHDKKKYCSALCAGRQWKDDNRDEFREKERIYKRNRPLTLPGRLRHSLRSRLNQAIRGNHRTGSAVRDLGCTIAELKIYLESKFLPGMSWSNWSKTGWHIDHIKPLSLFDLSDPEQLKAACHYTNLQPLWAHDNLAKNNKYEPQQTDSGHAETPG